MTGLNIVASYSLYPESLCATDLSMTIQRFGLVLVGLGERVDEA
jgi:hypothetical protein